MFSRASQSNHPGFLALLADTVYRHNYWQEAILVLKKSTEIVPEDVGLWLQLARIQSQVYHLEDCEESLLRAALAAGGEHAEVERLKIGLLGQYGDIKEYFDSLRRIYELNSPNNSTMLSGVLMASLYQDDWTPRAVADLHRSECRALVKKDDSALGSLKKDSPRSMLRVGYITGDLHRQHPVNLFMLPLLKQQQKQASMEVYIYHTGVMFDDYTQQARDCADRWVEASSMDDVSLHQRVLADQIDVLIDLAGHTSSNRLGVFSRRAAPVQVTFLGYPHSTGLPNMDYIIGDSIVSPAEDAHLFSEKILRLDHSVFCWAPVDEYPILPKPEATMSVVFGSFNNAMTLSPKTIALWAAVLKAVPNARLMLKGAPFASEEVCERYRVRFADHGVNAERIDFRGPSELSVMMQEYADVDIALDPIVYNGGTTSLQALWMGVPLVTLKGGSFASRMGASFLATLGKNEWVAEDERSYVRIASKLAKNINKIRESRYSLRREMEASPLSDIETYAQNFERVLREVAEVRN
jgi:predicted O-linked N-acetylglucosamine transferase (SPINDLY family)